MHRKHKNMLDYQLYIQRENQFLHQPYTNELSFYTAVRQGDLNYIREIKEKYSQPNTEERNTSKKESNGKGVLSKNPVKNELYHFIVNTAIITRNCIEGGMSQEIAYTLSDLYIRKADLLKDVNSLQELNDEMVWTFASKMHQLRTKQVVSKHISKCINYIYNNLHTPLTLTQLSQNVGINSSYLSTLFKKETGYSVHSFIQNTRLETAKNMLINTNYTYADISNTLCFSSQSHFIKLFRNKYGMTPAEYRRTHAVP